MGKMAVSKANLNSVTLLLYYRSVKKEIKGLNFYRSPVLSIGDGTPT